ncbi:MAG: TetR/AcrR family transcriptional regulator [Myxococcota bacterium]
MAPKSHSPKGRRRILDAARQVFFERGFEAANLDEVAAVAQVAKGTLYRYFSSKAELYVAVLAHNADVFVERMQAQIDPALPVLEQVRRLARFYYRHYTENPEYFRIFWALENQRMIGELPESLLEAVTGVWERCLSIVSEQLERGMKEEVFRPADPWTTAHLFWILGNGLLASRVDEHHPAPSGLTRAFVGGERVFADAIDLLLRGLCAAPPPPAAPSR